MEISPKTIIKEEISKILNEGFVVNNDNFLFKQRLNNSTFYGYDTFTTEYDTNILESDITVTWRVTFWVNDSGIENFIVNVDKIEGTYMMNMYDKQSDELMQETQKDINEIEWKFIINEASLPLNSSLYVKDLEFYFKDKTCTLNF